jgi:hypothetical protein
MFDLREFRILAAKQESGRVRDAMLLAAGEIERARADYRRCSDDLARVGNFPAELQAELAAAQAALEDKHRAWVTAERELEVARSVVEAADILVAAVEQYDRTELYGQELSGYRVERARYDAARRAGEKTER